MYRDIPDADLQQPRHVAEQLVARIIDQAREIDPDVVVEGDAMEGSPSRVLVQEASSATELVVGSRHLTALRSAVLGSVGVAAAGRTECPMIVVRGPAGLREEDAAVVVGVDATDRAQTVLAVGFDHASRHEVSLRPVLCWHPDLLATMKWRPSPPAPEQADEWLSEALAGWREQYPDVTVHPEVIREHPVAGLVLYLFCPVPARCRHDGTPRVARSTTRFGKPRGAASRHLPRSHSADRRRLTPSGRRASDLRPLATAPSPSRITKWVVGSGFPPCGDGDDLAMAA